MTAAMPIPHSPQNPVVRLRLHFLLVLDAYLWG